MIKINWINGQAGGTPLSAENLNLMQENIENAINDLESKINGTVLFENPNGVTTGDITLSESRTNYKRLVFYDTYGNKIGEMLTNATQAVLQQNDQGSVNTMLRIARLNIVNNTTLTFYSNVPTYYDGSTWSRNSTSYLTLGKIIGYNY